MKKIDIFCKQILPWMEQYSPQKVWGKYGIYYTISSDHVKEITRKCRRSHIKTRVYDECWARGTNYRNEYLKTAQQPYRCVYCGRKLSKESLVVDHVIPVAKAKSSPRARRKLKRQGIENVNDIRNLVAACQKCNKKKGEKMGVWVWRARHPKV